MKKVLSIVITLALIAVFAGCANLQTGEVSKSDIPTIATTSSVSKNEANAETTTETPSTDVSGESTVATAPASETVKLTDLTSVADAPKMTDKLTDNYGNTYGEAVINYTTNYEYLLDGKYSALKGTLYIPNGESSDEAITLTVKGDGYVLYSSPLMAKTSRPQDFEVNISGINKLVIQWSKNTNYISCCLANAVLVSGEGEALDTKTLPREITDLTSIAEKPKTTDKLTDVLGNTYNYAIYNSIGKDSCFEYLLDKKYGKFKGTLYFPKGETTTESFTVTLTADGEKIYESPAMTTTSGPVDFEVDVSKCNDFKINFSKNGNWGTICIGNAYIYDA